MAKLKALPNIHIINGFKGAIDFYVHRGIPCARRWPRYHKRTPSPAEAQTQTDFAYITKALVDWPPELIAIYQAAVQDVPYRWQDLAVQGYISGITHEVVS